MKRLDEDRLVGSEVVANAAMNRARALAGVNSYARELRFDVLAFLRGRLDATGRVAWLDLCCGEARALAEAVRELRPEASEGRVRVVGVDLLPSPTTEDVPGLELVAASLHEWEPAGHFDLVTCVHGLHYVGDKLRLLERVATWLGPGGVFVANLDVEDIRAEDGSSLSRSMAGSLRRAGARYSRAARLLRMPAGAAPAFGLEFTGADDSAGPNYTMQPAVRSYYRKPHERSATRGKA